MINCPKCHVPNPDNATACAACGTPLASQQFAQAMDQAQQQAQPGQVPQQPMQPGQMPQQPGMPMQPGQMPQQPGMPMQPGQVPQQMQQQPMQPGMQQQPMQPGMQQQYVQPGMQQPGMPMQQPSPFGEIPQEPRPQQVMDPAQAQAEINKWAAEQKARKRMKTLIYMTITLVIVGIIGFFWIQSARKERRVREVFNFFKAFRLVDDEETATFWKCTVRARHRDVRLAKDTLEITEGLEKAFNNFPKSQPDHIKEKCLPQIAGILESLEKLTPPSGFEQPLESVKTSMKTVRTAMMAYANKIAKRKGEAINEQEVRAANQDFHMAQNVPDAPKAVAYYNLIKCAVPDLDKKVKEIKKPPDTQPVVEYVYETCKKDPTYADTLRKECFDRRNETNEKTKEYREAVYQMSGDNRDLSAINHCFTTANRGFDRVELEGVAKAFVAYRGARGEVLKALAKVKEETAD